MESAEAALGGNSRIDRSVGGEGGIRTRGARNPTQKFSKLPHSTTMRPPRRSMMICVQSIGSVARRGVRSIPLMADGRILAIDIGAGTMDVVLADPTQSMEN